MRLGILTDGYGFGTKLLFSLIWLFSRQPVPDAARLTSTARTSTARTRRRSPMRPCAARPPGRSPSGS
jgi:hypothetical protein